MARPIPGEGNRQQDLHRLVDDRAHFGGRTGDRVGADGRRVHRHARQHEGVRRRRAGADGSIGIRGDDGGPAFRTPGRAGPAAGS